MKGARLLVRALRDPTGIGACDWGWNGAMAGIDAPPGGIAPVEAGRAGTGCPAGLTTTV